MIIFWEQAIRRRERRVHYL